LSQNIQTNIDTSDRGPPGQFNFLQYSSTRVFHVSNNLKKNTEIIVLLTLLQMSQT